MNRTEIKSGRSVTTGRLRNFAAMSYWKLHGLYQDVKAEGNDPEALDLLEFYLLQHGEKNQWHKRYNEQLGL